MNKEENTNKEGSIGALIGSIIIIIILVMGGWYVWQEAKRITNIPPIEREITITEEDTGQLEMEFESDILLDIDSDIDKIDQEFE